MPRSRNRVNHRQKVHNRQLRGQMEYNKKINRLKAITEMNREIAAEQENEVIESEVVNIDEEE